MHEQEGTQMETPAPGAKSGLVIAWLGGNCPIQAKGTFDGVAFYFRARGTSVTCEVGPHLRAGGPAMQVYGPAEPWLWEGPVYEWPDAGWIPEERARSYIEDAYREYVRGDYMKRRAEQVARNEEKREQMRRLMRDDAEPAT